MASAPRPQDFDKRSALAAPPPPDAANSLAEAVVATRVPGAEISRHAITGSPQFIHSRDRFLTGPMGEGGAVQEATAAAYDAKDPLRPVKAFLSEHRALFGHGPEALAAADITADYVDAHNGLHTVVWQQQVDGIPVFHAIFKAHVTKHGELVNLGSGFVPDPVAAADRGTPDRAALVAQPAISALRAIVIAAETLGEALAADAIVPIGPPEGLRQMQNFKPAPRVPR